VFAILYSNPVVALSLFATSGQILMTRAYLLAPASQIGPFSYSSIIFGSLLGWIFWEETLDQYFIFGAGLVLAAGILVLNNRTVSG